MKRYFQPIGKDGSSKKPSLSKEDGDENTDQVSEEEKKKEPLKFLTWNANSFLIRVKNNWPEFTKFVSDLDPDVIAVQVIHAPLCCSLIDFRVVFVWGFHELRWMCVVENG